MKILIDKATVELALEALESLIFNKPFHPRYSDVLTALKKALVQPKQERPWVGLTDKEFNSIFDQYKGTRYIGAVIECVEAKLKEKNT